MFGLRPPPLPGGRLLLIGADAHPDPCASRGDTGGTVDASYATSKARLHGLTRALAREFGQEGLQVNAVAPGPVETDMNDDIPTYLESIEFHDCDRSTSTTPAEPF